MIFQGFVSRGRDYYSPFGEIDIWTPIYIFLFSVFFLLAENNRTKFGENYLRGLELGLPIRYFVNITVRKMEIKCSCLLLGLISEIFSFRTYTCVVIDETLRRYFYSVNDYEFRLLFFFSQYQKHTRNMY